MTTFPTPATLAALATDRQRELLAEAARRSRTNGVGPRPRHLRIALAALFALLARFPNGFLTAAA